MSRRLKHWGWGYEDEQPSHEKLRASAAFLSERLGFGHAEPERPVPLSAVSLPPPRLRIPRTLAAVCSADTYERALHSYGRSYGDIVRAFRGRFDHPPDIVARPRDEEQVQMVLEWAVSASAAVIPFGGGTSVVGGVEPRVGEEYAGVVTIDLGALDRVLEVDAISLAAQIQAGARGPGLEQQLAAHGLTLRHYPQSFQFSTLGGWIATRAGGHFATLYTHIDDLVESVRGLTAAARGGELEQWAAIKRAASEAVIDGGGTITHHHAVGREHRPWYDRQRPDPFAAALRGAKAAVDPTGALNPGVLIDPATLAS